MSTPTSIGIGNDLPAGQASIAMGSTYHELLARVDDVSGVHEQFFWDGDLDDFVEDIFPDFLVGDVRVVLS